MPTPTLSKHTIWGFSLQSAYNTLATSNIRWLPYSGTLSYGHAGRMELLDVSDLRDSPSEALPSGDWGEGDIEFPLYADSTSLTDLVSWIQDRDSYNQGKWASVYIVRKIAGTYAVEGWKDVKVRQAQLVLAANDYVKMTLSLTGRTEAIGHGVSAPSTPTSSAPYNLDSVTAKTAFDSGSLTADVDIKRATITHENVQDDVANGFTLAGSLSPTYIDNLGGARATVELDRKYVDDLYFTAYKSHLRYGPRYGSYELGLQFVCTGTSTLTIDLPEVVINEHPRSYPAGTRNEIPETIRLSALRSQDGATDPITWTVS